MESNPDGAGRSEPPAEPIAAGAAPPSGALPTEHPGVSRRLLIIGGVAVVIAAGGGVAAGFIEHVGAAKPTPPSRAAARGLTDALAAERRLVADVATALATVPAHSGLHSILAQVHRDHVAHVRALDALVSEESTRTSPSTSTSASARSRSKAMGRAALHAAEVRAGTRAAALATTMTGQAATVLASIAACEATHAELLA